jgi:hypothetical protein
VLEKPIENTRIIFSPPSAFKSFVMGSAIARQAICIIINSTNTNRLPMKTEASNSRCIDIIRRLGSAILSITPVKTDVSSDLMMPLLLAIKPMTIHTSRSDVFSNAVWNKCSLLLVDE